MALNINYQGNVVDENGISIDCSYQAFSANIGKWGDIKATEQGQYNVNFGDGDLNTQSGSISSGDTLVIAFWTGGATRNDELEIFSVVAFTYSGTDNTIQNVQLIPPVAPSCSFSLASEGLVGVSASVNSYASTTFQWTFDSKTHYLRRNWYGQTIFGYLDIAGDEFDFISGYSNARNHTYTISGDYLVKHLVGNTYNLSSECSKTIRIRYRTPIPGLSITPSPAIIGQEITVTASIQDIDSRILVIDHVFDNIEIFVNTDKLYSYAYTLDTFKPYEATQFIDWNDGFDDHTIEYNKSVIMDNLPPEVTVSVNKVDDNKTYGASVVASDLDGTIVNLCWELYYGDFSAGDLPSPFFSCEGSELAMEPVYTKIYEKCDPSQIDLDMLFSVKGDYRLVVTATDNLGATGYDTIDFGVDDVCFDATDCPECPECPDCPEPEDCPELPEPEDCTDKINIAVRELKLKLLEEMDKNNRTIVVQDSRVTGSAKAKIKGTMEGEIDSSNLTGELSTNMGGKISSSKTSSRVGGKIDGKIKGE